MRMMVTARIPVQKGSTAIKDGTLPRVIHTALEEMKPECAYFCIENGVRTMRAVFDLERAQDMVPMFEPAMMELDATLEMIPVLTAPELEAGFKAMR